MSWICTCRRFPPWGVQLGDSGIRSVNIIIIFVSLQGDFIGTAIALSMLNANYLLVKVPECMQGNQIFNIFLLLYVHNHEQLRYNYICQPYL